MLFVVVKWGRYSKKLTIVNRVFARKNSLNENFYYLVFNINLNKIKKQLYFTLEIENETVSMSSLLFSCSILASLNLVL